MSSGDPKRGSVKATVEREELKKRIVGMGSPSPSTSPSTSGEFSASVDSFFSSLFKPKDDQTPKRTSMTRPRFLPPKDLEEEERHLREYEEMMANYQLKVAEEERRKELQRRERLVKENKIVENTRRWEEDILPNWEQKRNLRSTRELWWQGIPPRLRERIWVKASGNKVQVTPQHFLKLAKEGQDIRIALESAERAMENSHKERIAAEKVAKKDPAGSASDINKIENPNVDLGKTATEMELMRMFEKEESDAKKASHDISVRLPNATSSAESYPSLPPMPTLENEQIAQESAGDDHLAAGEIADSFDKELLSEPAEKPSAESVLSSSPPSHKSNDEQPPSADAHSKLPGLSESDPSGEKLKDLENDEAKGEMTSASMKLLGKEKSVNQIVVDLPRTFPALSFFQPNGPYYPGLRQVLEAYSVMRPEIGYVQGMSYVAAALLLNLEPFEAFHCLSNILSSKLLTAFYKMNTKVMERVFKAFDKMLAKYLPELHFHLKSRGVFHALYLIDWILTVYTKSLPIDLATRFLDIYFFEGEYFIFRTALGILSYLAADLLASDFDAILRIIQRLGSQTFDEAKFFATIQGVALNAEETRQFLRKAREAGDADEM